MKQVASPTCFMFFHISKAEVILPPFGTAFALGRARAARPLSLGIARAEDDPGALEEPGADGRRGSRPLGDLDEVPLQMGPAQLSARRVEPSGGRQSTTLSTSSGGRSGRFLPSWPG